MEYPSITPEAIEMNATAIATANIRPCARCGIKYDWRRSANSSLKMTYCNSLCEKAGLGFTIEALLRTEFTKAEKVEAASTVTAVDWDEVGEMAWAA